MPAPEPEDLRELGRKIDEARGTTTPFTGADAPPSAWGIAGRFATEFMVAIGVGVGLGWLLDHFLHTAPIFMVVMFFLGAAAGEGGEESELAEAGSRKTAAAGRKRPAA